MTGRTIGILVVTGAASGWLLLRGNAVSSGNAWTPVTRGDLVITVEIEGTLQSTQSHFVGPPAIRGLWEYRIAGMVSDGEDVAAGTEVLTFDKSQLSKQMVELQAVLETAQKEIHKKVTAASMRKRDDALRLEEARGKLSRVQLQLTRPDELVAAKEIRVLELDRALAEKEVAYLEQRRRFLDEADRTELAILQEQRDRATARVAELRDAMGRMTLSAPHGGTVIHVSRRGDEPKRVGDAVWRHELVLSIPDLTEMIAEGTVDESDSGRVALGQPVELRLDAYPDARFTGRVRDIGKTVLPVSRNSWLRGVQITVSLDETDPTRMRPEMRFRGTVEVDRVTDALLLPISAVSQRNDEYLVTVASSMGSREANVTLGRRNATYVEVLHGLSENERVRIAFQNRTVGDAGP